MHRFLLAAAMTLLFAQLAPAEAVQVRLNAKVLWKKTGIVLHAGDVVTITASGRWSWGRPRLPRPRRRSERRLQRLRPVRAVRLLLPGAADRLYRRRPQAEALGRSVLLPADLGLHLHRLRPDLRGTLWRQAVDRRQRCRGDAVGGRQQALRDRRRHRRQRRPQRPPRSPSPRRARSICRTRASPRPIPAATSRPPRRAAPGRWRAARRSTRRPSVRTTSRSSRPTPAGNASSTGAPYVVVDGSSAAVLPTGGTFAPTYVGTRSAVRQFVLSNPQSSAIAITGISVQGDYEIYGTTCGASLAAHKTCRINVDFRPGIAGTGRGELDVAASVAVTPVPLWGVGTLARALPGALAFADQPQGTTSAPQAVAIHNDQGCRARHQGDRRQWRLRGRSVVDLPRGVRSRSAGAAAVAVTFTPTAAGRAHRQPDRAHAARDGPGGDSLERDRDALDATPRGNPAPRCNGCGTPSSGRAPHRACTVREFPEGNRRSR